MNPVYKRMIVGLLQSCVVVVPLLLGAGKPAHAASVATCPSTNPATLDARLAAKADEGMVPLHRFVMRTRMVYQLDMNEALTRAERYRRAVDTCRASSLAGS